MTSVLKAVDLKYEDDNFKVDGANDDPGDGFVVFAPKVKQIPKQRFPTLILSDYGIEVALDASEEEERLKELLSSLHELDLSRNKISDFDEVLKILKMAPSLRFCNLSFNDLQNSCEAVSSTHKEIAMDKLSTLVLVGTKLTWSNVLKLLEITSSCLHEINLSFNNYESIDLGGEGDISFPTVKKVMFNGNFIHDWNEVFKLSKIFPSLEHLGLSECPIDDIKIAPESAFSCLRCLNLSKTLIDLPEKLSRLDHYSGLTELRISGSPYWDNLPENVRRHHTIALLPRLSYLHGGARITDDERETAERAFVRFYQDSIDSSLSRYHELKMKYGRLDPLVTLDKKVPRYVKVRIMFEDQLLVEKKIDTKMTVWQLKVSLEKFVKFPASRMNIYHLDMGLNLGKDIMKFNEKKLYLHKINENDEIYIERRKRTNTNAFSCLQLGTLSECD